MQWGVINIVEGTIEQSVDAVQNVSQVSQGDIASIIELLSSINTNLNFILNLLVYCVIIFATIWIVKNVCMFAYYFLKKFMYW